MSFILRLMNHYYGIDKFKCSIKNDYLSTLELVRQATKK